MIQKSSSHSREEYLKKKKRRRNIRYGIFVFLIILFVSLVSYGAHRPEVRISKVELSGGVLVTQDEVQQAAVSYMKGSYLWLFPKDNRFLYPKKGLENFLLQTFKRIDTIHISSKGFQTIVVTITERKPFAIWCDTPPASTQATASSTAVSDTLAPNEQCYFLDQNSTIFSDAPDFSGDAYMKYYGLITATSPIGAEYMSSTTEFAEISDFVTQIKSFGLQPEYILASADDQFSMHLLGGTDILFDTKESLSKVAQNFEALLHTADFKTMQNGNLPVDYVDMRYGNKLFYKLKTQ